MLETDAKFSLSILRTLCSPLLHHHPLSFSSNSLRPSYPPTFSSLCSLSLFLLPSLSISLLFSAYYILSLYFPCPYPRLYSFGYYSIFLLYFLFSIAITVSSSPATPLWHPHVPSLLSPLPSCFSLSLSACLSVYLFLFLSCSYFLSSHLLSHLRKHAHFSSSLVQRPTGRSVSCQLALVLDVCGWGQTESDQTTFYSDTRKRRIPRECIQIPIVLRNQGNSRECERVSLIHGESGIFAKN